MKSHKLLPQTSIALALAGSALAQVTLDANNGNSSTTRIWTVTDLDLSSESSISAASIDDLNLVTIVTAADHGFTSGDSVVIRNVGFVTTDPNGRTTITVVDPTTFTYSKGTNNTAETFTIDGDEVANRTATLTPNVTAGNTQDEISGVFTGGTNGASDLVGESYALNFLPVSDWDPTAAQAALTGDTFDSYLAGLNSTEVLIDGAANAWGVDTSGITPSSIAAASIDSANLVTIETSADHNFVTGKSISVSGLGFTTTDPNVTADITVVDATTFTYTTGANNTAEVFTTDGDETATINDGQNTRFNRSGEAYVITMDLSGMSSASTLTIANIGFALATAADRVDFLIYDVSAGTTVVEQFDSTLGAANPADTILEDGDIIVVAHAASEFRFNALTFDVTFDSTPLPPSITHQPQDVSAFSGATVDFSVASDGSKPLSYQWRLDGIDIVDETNDTLQLMGVGVADAGDYTVVVTNSQGTDTSDPATLTIRPQATFDVASNADSANFRWTVTDLDASPPSIATSSGAVNVTGGFEGGAALAGESFIFDFIPVSDWDAIAAQTALGNGSFGTYVAGLNSAGALIDGSVTAWGVNTTGLGAAISAASIDASNLITVTTATGHGVLTGDTVTITGLGFVTTDPNTTTPVTVLDATTFTYTAGANNTAETFTVDGSSNAHTDPNGGLISANGASNNPAIINEAIVLTVELDGLLEESSTLSLADIGFTLNNASDRVDFIIYDVSEGTSAVEQFNVTLGAANPASTVLEHGDIVVVGYSAGNGYRLNTLTTRIDSEDSSSAFDTWASDNGLDGSPGFENGKDDDPDGDSLTNFAEFAFGGDPLDASDRGQIFLFTNEDGDGDVDTDNELILTYAVRSGAPAFAGTPSPSSSIDGIDYSTEGTFDLFDFTAPVTPISPVVTDLPGAPADYEYRSFSLDGSNNLPDKGFLRGRAEESP